VTHKRIERVKRSTQCVTLRIWGRFGSLRKSIPQRGSKLVDRESALVEGSCEDRRYLKADEFKIPTLFFATPSENHESSCFTHLTIMVVSEDAWKRTSSEASPIYHLMMRRVEA